MAVPGFEPYLTPDFPFHWNHSVSMIIIRGHLITSVLNHLILHFAAECKSSPCAPGKGSGAELKGLLMLHLRQSWANYALPPAFIKFFFFKHSHVHWCIYCVWLLLYMPATLPASSQSIPTTVLKSRQQHQTQRGLSWDRDHMAQKVKKTIWLFTEKVCWQLI